MVRPKKYSQWCRLGTTTPSVAKPTLHGRWTMIDRYGTMVQSCVVSGCVCVCAGGLYDASITPMPLLKLGTQTKLIALRSHSNRRCPSYISTFVSMALFILWTIFFLKKFKVSRHISQEPSHRLPVCLAIALLGGPRKDETHSHTHNWAYTQIHVRDGTCLSNDCTTSYIPFVNVHVSYKNSRSQQI